MPESTNVLRLQLLFEDDLALMQPAELVDLVLVFPSDLHFITASGSLVLFRKLCTMLASADIRLIWKGFKNSPFDVA